MTKDKKLINSLRNLQKKQSSSYSGVVISVNLVEQTAVVEIDKDYQLPDVRLKALIDETEQAVLIVPKIGSNVLVSFIEESKIDAFIIKYSEIENIDIKIGKIEYEINSEGSVLKNGNHLIESNNIILGSEINAEQSVKGTTLNNLLTEIITHLQVIETLIVSYGTAQAIELPIISASNTTLATGITTEMAKLTVFISKLNLHLSNKVKIA